MQLMIDTFTIVVYNFSFYHKHPSLHGRIASSKGELKNKTFQSAIPFGVTLNTHSPSGMLGESTSRAILFSSLPFRRYIL